MNSIFLIAHAPRSANLAWLSCTTGCRSMLALSASWLIGDKLSDLECAHRAGARGVLVKTGYGEAEAARAGEGAAFIAEDFASAVERILRPA